MGKSKSKSGGARNYTPLLTARPKGMSYQEYRERRAYQNAWLKERLKGFICYVSSELVVYDKITGLPRLFNHRTDRKTMTRFGISSKGTLHFILKNR